jgi:serine/threonine protein kinase
VVEPPPSIEDLRTPVTQTGAVMGTPAYMAPEQFAGAPVDARADQFAFCVTAWEALWRERPFAGASYAELSAAISQGRRAAADAPGCGSRARARAVDRSATGSPPCTRCSTRCARPPPPALDGRRGRDRGRGIAARGGPRPPGHRGGR